MSRGTSDFVGFIFLLGIFNIHVGFGDLSVRYLRKGHRPHMQNPDVGSGRSEVIHRTFLVPSLIRGEGFSASLQLNRRQPREEQL